MHKEIEVALQEAIADREQGRAKHTVFLGKRLEKLSRQRQKLLEAWYAEAIPMDLFKQEQNRIGSEIAHVEVELTQDQAHVEEVREIIRIALALLDNPYLSYTSASPEHRKLWNAAVFKKIQTKAGKVAKVVHEEPFATLLSRSNFEALVPPTGFEPVPPP